MSGAEKFLEVLFGEANGQDSLAQRHRKVIKSRIEEAEDQISQLKLKLSGSATQGMQFNKDSPCPPDPIPDYPVYALGNRSLRTRGGQTIFGQKRELQ